MGLGHLMSIIGQQSTVARTSPSKLDSAFGLYTFAGSIGQAIGPALIVLFGGSNVVPNTTALFAAFTAATAIMLIFTFRLAMPKPAGASATTTAVPCRKICGKPSAAPPVRPANSCSERWR